MSYLTDIFSGSATSGYWIYLLLGCLRGFTLIPTAYLLLIGIIFFKPVPLFIINMIGTLVSSACVYYFSESLRFDKFFEHRYGKLIEKTKLVLQKNELPIVIGWSLFPLTPTDLICYVCGTLKIDIKKFLFGIFIGEAVGSSLYIYFGDYILKLAHLR